MADWRNEILAGVSEVIRNGAPGNILIYGTNSDAILTNDRAEVLIAAGEMENGRTVVFSQDNYTLDFLRTPLANPVLTRNIKMWVTHGAYVNDDEIENVDNYDDFDDIPATCTILVWVGMRSKSKAFHEKMRLWMKAGGGVVCGATPWGFLLLYPDMTLEQMPLYNVLNGLGMAYTPTNMFGDAPFPVNTNQAENARIDRAITAAADDLNFLVEFPTNIDQAVQYLPDRVVGDVVPDVTHMVETHAATVHCQPRPSRPVRTPGGRALAGVICRIMNRMEEYNGNRKAEGIDEFPGDFDSPPDLETPALTFTSSAVTPAKVNPTGFYLPAGSELVLTSSSIPGKPWSVLVGSHPDTLYHLVQGPDWSRWPQVQMVREISSIPLRFSSPFGGLVYVRSPGNSSSTFSFTLSGVTRAPRYIPGEGGDWEQGQRGNPGLWADVSGESFTVSLPASSVRDLPDPTATMQTWDEVMAHHLALRGMDPFHGRGQWTVTDQQPSAGYMHSGYPVVTGLDVADPAKVGEDPFLLNGELLRATGMWGMFHELGHNLQDPSYTWSGTVEVTCNIFTLYTMDQLTGQAPWEHPWVQRQKGGMRAYLQEGAHFQSWLQRPGVALGIYAQQARDLGWDAYRTLFREYNALPPGEKPSTDDQKIDQWIERFSKVAGRNLCPMFDFWGFPIRASVLDAVRHLPAFLQDDETTREMAPQRAEDIRRKYGMD